MVEKVCPSQVKWKKNPNMEKGLKPSEMYLSNALHVFVKVHGKK